MNKFFTKIAALSVGLAMAIGVGVAIGSKSQEAKSVSAAEAAGNYSLSFTGSEIDNFASSYASRTWTNNTTGGTSISGTAVQSYKSTQAGFINWIQMNRSSSRVAGFFNTTQLPGKITSITIHAGVTSGSRTVKAYVMSSAASYSSGNSLTMGSNSSQFGSSATVNSTSGTDYSFSGTTDYKFFAIQVEANSAIYFKTITVNYTVTQSKSDVELSLGSASSSMIVGGTQTLSPTASAGGSTVTGLSYSYVSSNTSVATVSSSGKIDALSFGKTKITVTSAETSSYNSGSVELNLTVSDPNVAVNLDFPDCNDSTVTTYTSTWEATDNDYTFSIYGANNSFDDHIRIGRKDNASSPTFTSPKISERVTSVNIVFSAVNTSKLTSADLIISANSDFSNATTIDFASDVAVDTVSIEIPNATSAVNLYYKIAFEIASSSNNGEFHINQIYFRADAVDELQSLAISGAVPTYTAGSTFSFGRTATAHYSSSGDVVVTTGLSFTLGGTAISAGDTIPVSKVGTQAIVVTYTDSNNDSVSAAAYNATVNYKGATEIELNVTEADLSIGGTVSLTATVGDQYADPNAVSWSSGNTSVATVSAASGTKTITVTGVGDGNTTIIATANGHSVTCDITVSSDPVLNLLDDKENIINDQTLNFFTGDASVYIQAYSENVASPVYSWSNEDNSVVTIDASDYLCEVTIVGAGDSDVSVTVGSLTRTVTFSVSQSGVTALTLTSSVVSGEIYDGTYLNTLTLTPNITKQGNATNVINWSSSDTSVAIVSSASTSGTAITVTGKSEGTAVITARSAYTPATYVEYTVTVLADGVTTFSWTNKPYFDSDSSKSHIQIYTNDTTLAQIAAAGSSSYGTFAPTWVSGKSDSPSFGTGANDVHLVLSPTVVNSEEGLTPLSASSTFTKNDNGKYVLAFYKGVRAQGTMPTLTVINWRSVIESSTTTTTGTFDFSCSSAKGTLFTTATLGQRYSDSGGLAAPSISGITALYDGNGSGGAIQGSGFARIGKTGSVTLTFANGINISSVTMGLRSWSSSEHCTVSVTNCDSFTTSNGDYEQHTFTLSSSTNAITISTNSARAFIDAITITATAGGEQQIGKTSDCLELEVYIDTYLHMDDYTSSQGWCKDNDHNYYGKNTETGAKYHFNQLNLHQRTLLSSNSAYVAEWARLSAWAAANGESLNAQTKFSVTSNPIMLATKNTSAVIIIVVISAISVAAIGGYFLFRKKKEN